MLRIGGAERFTFSAAWQYATGDCGLGVRECPDTYQSVYRVSLTLSGMTRTD